MKVQGEKRKVRVKILFKVGNARCVFVCTNTFHLAQRDNRPFPNFWKLIPHFEPILTGTKEAIGTIETIENTATRKQKTIRASKIIRYR